MRLMLRHSAGLAFPVGLEPTTIGLEDQYSIQLSYGNRKDLT